MSGAAAAPAPAAAPGAPSGAQPPSPFAFRLGRSRLIPLFCRGDGAAAAGAKPKKLQFSSQLPGRLREVWDRPMVKLANNDIQSAVMISNLS